MCLTSVPWGLAADIRGRRAVLLAGSASSALSALLLGLSGSYGAACAVRFIGGLANGTLGAMKAVIADVADARSSAVAFAYLSVAWGAGAMIGPALGGGLAKPCGSGGALAGGRFCSESSLFVAHPFLLPCLVSALLLAASTALTYCMKETMPPRPGRAVAAAAAAASPPGDDTPSSEEEEEEAAEEGRPLLAVSRADLQLRPLSSDHDGGDDNHESAGARLLPPSSFSSSSLSLRKPSPRDCSARQKGPRWFRSPQCVLCLSGYGLAAFMFIFLDEARAVYTLNFPSISQFPPLFSLY